MCFPRVPVIVIVILRHGSGEGLLKYINVGDKSTMVARLPQQVFLLLVLVIGTTMGIGMYGMELPKSTKSSHPPGIRQDGTSGDNPSKKISHKTISRFEEASNTQIPIPKSDSSDIRARSLEESTFSSWNEEEMHHTNGESKFQAEEWKNNYPGDESASPLLSPSTKRPELQSISRRDGFVRLQRGETWETSSSSAFYHSLEDNPSLRSPGRTSGSFLLSSPASHPLSLSSSSMTSPFSSGDVPLTSPSTRSLSSEVSLSSPDDYPKTTLPSLSTNANSIPVTQLLELDKKLPEDVDQIEDEKMRSDEIEDSKLERLSNEFTKTTRTSLSSSTTNSIPGARVLELDKKLPKDADQTEDENTRSDEIEDSTLERLSNKFSISTRPSSRTSTTNNVPATRVLELDKKLSKGADQIEDEKMRSDEIEDSKLERLSNEFTKTTRTSLSSSTTNSIPGARVLELDKKLPKDADQTEDENTRSDEIGDSTLERLSNKFSISTRPTSSTSTTNNIPATRVLELDKKLTKGADQIKDKKIETEDSTIERFPNEFTKSTQPSTSTNSISVTRVLEVDHKFPKSTDRIDDNTMGSRGIEGSKLKRLSNESTKTTQPTSSTGIEDNTMGNSEIKDSKLKRLSNEFTKTTQPSSTTITNSIPVTRGLEVDDKFSKSPDRIEDNTAGSEIEDSKLKRFSNEFTKITQPISSTTTNSIPISRILDLHYKFSKGADRIEDQSIGPSKIEVSKLEWFSTDFLETTTLSLSASIPASRIPELTKEIANIVVQTEDRKMRNSETEVSKFPSRFSNKFHSSGTAKKILTTELPTNARSIIHKNGIKSSMWQLTGNEYEIRHLDWLTGNRAALTAITLPETTGFGFSKRYTRDSPEIDVCESFETGDPVKKEFYSPNYPENYPPLTNCVLVLEAEKGELLKLDFRETFELESRTPDGECRFDYLEVRDGQYGFSPKIGTYCGKTFPPEIISQSRYLWLNFHSDDTIEYQGFKAVWSTVPRPHTGAIPVEQDPCIYYEDIPADFELKSDMIKEAKTMSETNRVALDCLWVLKAKPSMKMQLTFDSFKLEKPNDCSANFLDIFDGETDEPSRVKKFCGSIAEALSTKTNRMYVRLYLELKAINSSFSALITAVRDKDPNQVNCKADEFDCQDATCIARSLRCNRRKNCRFQGDEAPAECGTSSEKQDRSRIVIILVIFSLIMFGMCSAFVFNCVRKLRRDHRIIREHIRQSREDRLDEIGRRATPCPLSVSRTDLREGGSESPAGEEVDSSKELIPAATLTTRDYTKELTLKMKYGTKEITDIHQSNNVSNATQERLQESSEEPDMCDSSCQTRESLFAPIIPDAILSSPAFSTFGYETIAGPENGLSHKGTPASDSSYRHHRHQHHPPPLSKQTSQKSQESHRKNSQASGYPISERCSHEGSAQICPKHNPIPAPPGWSLHDPPYPQIVPESSGCPDGGDNSSYRRYHSPKPDHESSIGPSIYQQHQYQYPPPVFTRQNTVGSGERYGSYIYGSGRASSNTASSNATTTSATTTPTTSNTTGSGSPHLATPKHSKTDPRYRAEAVIEVDQKRPFSIESTKSAPDVIATH